MAGLKRERVGVVVVVAYQAHLPALMQAAEAAGFCANVAWLVHEPLTSILDEFTTACLAGALAYQWPAEYANGTNLAGNESAARAPPRVNVDSNRDRVFMGATRSISGFAGRSGTHFGMLAIAGLLEGVLRSVSGV